MLPFLRLFLFVTIISENHKGKEEEHKLVRTKLGGSEVLGPQGFLFFTFQHFIIFLKKETCSEINLNDFKANIYISNT